MNPELRKVLYVQLRHDCRLCKGHGLLPVRLRSMAYWERMALAIDIDKFETAQAKLCCQICDSGEVLPVDLECDPDSY